MSMYWTNIITLSLIHSHAVKLLSSYQPICASKAENLVSYFNTSQVLLLFIKQTIRKQILYSDYYYNIWRYKIQITIWVITNNCVTYGLRSRNLSHGLRHKIIAIVWTYLHFEAIKLLVEVLLHLSITYKVITT